MPNLNYEEVNVDTDKRFTENELDKREALAENEKIYIDLINQSKDITQQQIDAANDWEDQQKKIQQEQTDFTIQQIEQQKEEAEKAQKKEAAGAYQDYMKKTSKHGATAEGMAAGGMANTGYSESSNVSMYNTYQNRVATAKESLDKVMVEFNNAITEARLHNSSAQAEIAYNALQQRLQLIMSQFEYESGMMLEMNNQKLNIENMYYGRYMDIVNQINTENAAAEAKRQYDEQFAYQKAQDERNYQLQREQMRRSSSSKSSEPKTPSEKQYAAALAAFKKNGEDGLMQYLETVPGVNADLLINYAVTYGQGNWVTDVFNQGADFVGTLWKGIKNVL